MTGHYFFKEVFIIDLKYEYTDETMEYADCYTLRRIRRLSDGKLSGWIEDEYNLSHEGSC